MKIREVSPLRGVVERLFPREDCGFIRSADGREFYFHRSSIVGGQFDALRIGTAVRFAIGEGGDAGTCPQASSVVPIGKHHR